MKKRILAAQDLACRWHWVAALLTTLLVGLISADLHPAAFLVGIALFLWEVVGVVGHYRLRSSYIP